MAKEREHSEYFEAKQAMREIFFWKKGDRRYRVIPYGAVQEPIEGWPHVAVPVIKALQRVKDRFGWECMQHFYRTFNFRDILRHPITETTIALAVTLLERCFEDGPRTRTLLRKLHRKLRQIQRVKYYPQEALMKRLKRRGGTK